jgi:hypothetical protein
VSVCFGAEIGKIYVAIFQTRDGDDFETCHDRASRVCPMCGRRDETHIAMGFTTRGVILANGEQPCEFALRPGVGLQ